MRWLGAAAPRTAAALGLAAAPTFALLALHTARLGGGPLEEICAPRSPWSGMAAMYLIMAAFHLPPWLRLLGRPAGPRAPREGDESGAPRR